MQERIFRNNWTEERRGILVKNMSKENEERGYKIKKIKDKTEQYRTRQDDTRHYKAGSDKMGQ